MGKNIFLYSEATITGLSHFLTKHKILGLPINFLLNLMYRIKKLFKKRENFVFEGVPSSIINSEDTPNSNLEMLRNDIMLNTHFLEKNLIINNTKVPNQFFIDKIYSSTKKLILLNPNFDRFSCLLGTAVINKYKPELIDKHFVPFVEESSSLEIGKKDGLSFNNTNGLNFLKSRYSHRILENEIVDEDTIKKIIDLSLSCPSDCNRQPCRIAYSSTSEGNNKIKFFVPDPAVKKNVYNFLAVIVDSSYFSKSEEYQYLINGGICLYNTLLACHAFDFGAMIFQAPTSLQSNVNFRNLFKMKESEFVVGFVGFGKKSSISPAACAAKKNSKSASFKVE